MLNLKTGSAACIAAFGVATLGFSSIAAAAPLTLQYTGFVNSPAELVTVTAGPNEGTFNAGAFQFTMTSSSPPDSFIAYCIELTQVLGTTVSNYTTTNMIDYGWSAARRDNIAKLFNSAYASSLDSATNSAAFQLALWEVVYETGPLSLTSGVFQGSSSSNVNTRAASYVAGIGLASAGIGQFTLYESPTNQNYIRFSVTSSGGGRVPEPGTALLLAGLGLAGCAGRLFRSRTKTSR